MAYSVSEYLQLLLNLLPHGRAWSRHSDGVLYKLLHAHAAELQRVDLRSDELRKELDIRYSTELLIDHEEDLGLPDDCIAEAQTIAQRRTRAHTKFIDEGGIHKQSYIDMATDLGYTIAITEYTPAWAGMAVAGDPCGAQANIFYALITITLSPDDFAYFTCGSSSCGDLLASVGDTTMLQCVLNKFKPAHITFLFAYSGYAFDSAFDSAFDALPSSDAAYLAGAFGRDFDSAFNAYYGGGDFAFVEFDNSFYKPM